MDLKSLFKISYGLYVVGSGKGDEINGQIANSVMQVTADPVQLAICINKENFTHELIEKYQSFSVSVLEQDTPMTLIGDFGFKTGREFKKFENHKYSKNETGVPILLDNTIAWMEAKVLSITPVATHSIFIGEVIDSAVLSEAEPMTYAYYHKVKGGASPKNAPTFNKEINKAAANVQQDLYRCGVCGYIYDPKVGDAVNGVPPGTLFEDLPADWTCPVCKAGKDKFEYI